jgi:hypothetical protein
MLATHRKVSRPFMPRPRVAILMLVAFPILTACVHATGHLPSGPPPEYEETPLPTSASTALPADAGPRLDLAPASGGPPAR